MNLGANFFEHTVVLQSAVEDDQRLHGDRPVVCICDVSREEAFDRVDARDLLGVVPVKALKQICSNSQCKQTDLHITCFSLGSFESRWKVALTIRYANIELSTKLGSTYLLELCISRARHYVSQDLVEAT